MPNQRHKDKRYVGVWIWKHEKAELQQIAKSLGVTTPELVIIAVQQLVNSKITKHEIKQLAEGRK